MKEISIEALEKMALKKDLKISNIEKEVIEQIKSYIKEISGEEG